MQLELILTLLFPTIIHLSCGQIKEALQFNNPLSVEFGDPYILKTSY
jgi:hypothetical protein